MTALTKEPATKETTLSIWFVSRHPGAIAWVKSQPISVDKFCEHLDTSMIQSGDTVIGNLPVPMGAEIIAKGARYIYLSISVPSKLRGQELSETDLTRLGVSLHDVKITLGESLDAVEIN